MTTTERSRAPRGRGGGTTDLRPYLTALLATAYLIGWWALGTRAPKAATSPEPPPETAPRMPRQQPMATWYEDLPVEKRPAVDLPPGWRIVDAADVSGVTVREAVPAPVRAVPTTRRGRIRTRSS